MYAIKGQEESQLPVGITPVLKIWVWIALQMRHLPKMLQLFPKLMLEFVIHSVIIRYNAGRAKIR